MAWHIKFEKHKALKKMISAELMLIVWYPKRWYNFCLPENEKKEIEPTFTEGLLKCVSVVYNMGVLKHFLSDFLVSFCWSKYFKSMQYKSYKQRHNIVQSFSILPDQNISRGDKSFQ